MAESGESWRASDEPTPPPPAGEGRLRLVAHHCTRTRAGSCRIEVELEAADGRRVTGAAQAATGPTGELRLAAAATLQALESAIQGALHFDLLGVKSMRAFDATLVIVAVTAERMGAPVRLLGCVQAADALDHAAVLATLDATNRVCALALTR